MPICSSLARKSFANSENGAPPIAVAHTEPNTHDSVTSDIARRSGGPDNSPASTTRNAGASVFSSFPAIRNTMKTLRNS